MKPLDEAQTVFGNVITLNMLSCLDALCSVETSGLAVCIENFQKEIINTILIIYLIFGFNIIKTMDDDDDGNNHHAHGSKGCI